MLRLILKQSFSNQKRAMAVMVISVAMGTAISASLLTVAFDIQGKVSRELRAFGANILIEPRVEGLAGVAGQRRYLRQEDLVKAKTIFWRHNIMGLAPFLDAELSLQAGGDARATLVSGTWFSHALPLPGESAEFEVGVTTIAPWWDIEGGPPSPGSVMLGISLAREMGLARGDSISIGGRRFVLSGILTTGGPEDDRAFMDLEEMQSLLGLEGSISRVQVSALTTPMDDFAYKDPSTMTRAEYEKWYCTGYITSISKQLEEVFRGSRAKPVWKVAETEGNVLGRMSVLVYLLTAAALAASALGMSTTMAASVLRRLDEIGLMKAVGADAAGIVMIFLSEALIIGLVGGVIGYFLSLWISDYIGVKVFSIALTERGMLFPIALLSALAIAAAGSFVPVRRALKVKPAVVLKWAQ